MWVCSHLRVKTTQETNLLANHNRGGKENRFLNKVCCDSPSTPIPEVGGERGTATGPRIPASGPPFPIWGCCRRMHECEGPLTQAEVRETGRLCLSWAGEGSDVPSTDICGACSIWTGSWGNKWEPLHPSNAVQDVETQALSSTYDQIRFLYIVKKNMEKFVICLFPFFFNDKVKSHGCSPLT